MPPAVIPLSAFILAGGKSSRMGTDKAFVMFNGRTLLDRALSASRSLTPDVHIVGDPAKFTPFAPVVEDVFPGCGPLAGIHAALRSSDTDLNLILAVDLPFVSPELLRYLAQSAAASPGSMVTVPRTAEGWQPLCAIYRRSFAGRADQALRAQRYKIDALFDPPKTNVIGEAELSIAGFASAAFRNLNTPQELADASQ
jgi:molybdopterin-guanine dinucleotide biosynthesis protein A